MKLAQLFQLPSSRRLSQLETQVSVLTNASAEVESRFHWVKERLERIVGHLRAQERREIYCTFQSEDIEEYLKKWNEHYGKCMSLLHNSRNVAGKIQTASTEFSRACHELLSNAASFEENRRDIMDCIQLLQEHENSAYEVSQGFKELQRGVKSFRAGWEGFIEDEYREKSLTPSEAGLLRGFKGNFGSLTLKIGLTFTAFGILTALTGGVCGLANLPPSENGVDATLRAEAHGNENGMSIADVIRQLDPEADFADHFSAICSRLTVLCNLWATVSADIRAVENRLIVLNYGDKLDDRFKKRLVRIRDSYERLGFALYRYQTEVLS